MSRRKEIALVAVGVLAGLAVSAPAAAAGLMANPSGQTFYVNEQKVSLEAYEINGSNYVKLRDVGQAVGFGVSYDAASNSVAIRPDQPYAEEVNPAKLTNGEPITEENVLELLRQIQRDWPQDTVWGTRDTPGTHKNDVPSTEARRITGSYPVNSTYGCGGYAAMVSSLLWTTSPRSGPATSSSWSITPPATSGTWRLPWNRPTRTTPSSTRTATTAATSAGLTRPIPTAERTCTATRGKKPATAWKRGRGIRRASPIPGAASTYGISNK